MCVSQKGRNEKVLAGTKHRLSMVIILSAIWSSALVSSFDTSYSRCRPFRTFNELHADQKEPWALTRRDTLVALPLATWFLPRYSSAAATRANETPLYLLEPLYELKLSLDALATIDSFDPKKWPRMQRRLDKFFSVGSGDGSTVSERDVYSNIGKECVDTAESRLAPLEYTFAKLQLLRDKLGIVLANTKTVSADDENIEAQDIHRMTRDAQTSLTMWFQFVPQQDMDRLDQLVQHVNSADGDRDGKLSESELRRLSDDERVLWEARVGKFGRSKVEKSLGFKIGHKNFV